MKLHSSTFNYLLPNENQKDKMAVVRAAAKQFYDVLDTYLPEGPDKTSVIRELRTLIMWAMVTIMRNADGAPRED